MLVMRYLVDIGQKHSEGIQKLIKDGGYQDVAQFILVAIENQLYLEKTDTQTVESKSPTVQLPDVKGDNWTKNRWDAYEIQNITSQPSSLPKPKYSDLTLKLYGEEKTAWLWGQLNKIFPMKIGLRVLLRELQNEQSILLDSFVKSAKNTAAAINVSIRDHEEKLLKIRENRISAALPFHDEKSQARYQNHFLLNRRKDGLLDGMMALLKFCNIEIKNGRTFIGLTNEGIEFAKIINPVIDHSYFEESLSEDEINFYLDHISKNAVGEYFDIQWLLKKISCKEILALFGKMHLTLYSTLKGPDLHRV
jgi:hypothetical protein